MGAKRHSNADLARTTGDRVRFYSIYADDGKDQRDSTKHSEEQSAEAHDPESDAFLSKIDEGRNAQDWQIGIDTAQCLPHGGNERDNSLSIFCSKTHMQINIPVVALRERHKQSPLKGIVLHVVAMTAHDTDHQYVVRRAIFRRLSITNVLTDCFRIREKLPGHLVLNDPDAGRISIFGFGLGKIAAAQELYTDCIKIARRNCGEKGAGAGIRRFRIGWQRFARRHDT